MAKDVSNKTQHGNNIDETSPSLLDSQKVPPLRIVLNTAAGNQKAPASNSTGLSQTAHQETYPKPTSKTKLQDSKQQTDTGSGKGGRFRIKLGTNKQQSTRTTNNLEITTNDDNEEKEKNLAGSAGLSVSISTKDELSLSSSKSSNYLRRITRRSQRSVQVITNEDEESISSMTSTDENQINQISNSDSNPAQEQAPITTGQQTVSNTNGAVIVSSTSNSQSVETPRKYKKRRGETSESLTNEQLLFSLQNYSVPVQNSFKLFKNIRQQVDKKLDTLNTTLNPKAPRGFHEYMIAQGSYILDGFRLGNGANLAINENGGMNIVSGGRSNSRKLTKMNYIIPDRAHVPLNIPCDSPLRDLFVEQEKERYRMRMQHIKEREKLTLAAEQEIMRVYNQAAMASINQVEPLSVCTMLKHQEIYNYMDSEGVAIQAAEENSQDEVSQEGVKTRRRQHEQVSPPQVRKSSNAGENQPNDIKVNNDTTENFSKLKEDTEKDSTEKVEGNLDTNEKETSVSKKRDLSPDLVGQTDNSVGKGAAKKLKTDIGNDTKNDISEKLAPKLVCDVGDMVVGTNLECGEDSGKISDSNKESKQDESLKDTETIVKEEMICKDDKDDKKEKGTLEIEHGKQEANNESEHTDKKNCIGFENIEKKEEDNVDDVPNSLPNDCQNHLQSQCKEMFVVQLQDIDDKWEKIRAEMLIRHRNEAESLHAVQRLEWEWKTKELDAIDVPSTLIVDDVLVPKLAIYSQDY